MLREYWIFRWEWNVWHGYLPFFYKDNERKKKEETMRLIINSEPWPFFWIDIWDNKKMKKSHGINNGQWVLVFSLKFEIDNERNDMVIFQWLIIMELLEPLIEWDETSC
jgi:hypothetical protein